jgi:hypothetical protein
MSSEEKTEQTEDKYLTVEEMTDILKYMAISPELQQVHHDGPPNGKNWFPNPYEHPEQPEWNEEGPMAAPVDSEFVIDRKTKKIKDNKTRWNEQMFRLRNWSGQNCKVERHFHIEPIYSYRINQMKSRFKRPIDVQGGYDDQNPHIKPKK